MTQRAKIIAGGLAIVLALLGFQSWGVAIGRIERHVIAAIERRTGLIVSGLEQAEIAILPLPRISLSNVSFAQREGPLAGKALRLRARLRLLSLLSGEMAFDRIDLVTPQIDIAAAGEGDTLADWFAPPLALMQPLLSQSRIVITSGSVFVRTNGAIRTILRDVNLVVEDRSSREPIAVSGSVNWRGVATGIDLLWPMAGERARLTLAATSSLLALRFEGVRAGLSDPVVNGRLTLTTRSLPGLLEWFGEKPRLAGAIGAFSLSADAQLKPREASLSNVVASLDGERLDGAIKLADLGSRWGLSGTLAGATLDLGRIAGGLGLTGQAFGARDATPLDFEAWTSHDIDLRVSVDAARFHGARLSDLATQILVRKGRFEAGLLRSRLYGGSVRARVLSVMTPGGVDVRLQAALDRVNFGLLAADVPEAPRLSGTGGLQLALEGVGGRWEDVLASFNGKAGLALRQGEIGGIALADMLRRIERNPALALRDWRQGKTPFETATLNASVANGVATLFDSQVAGAAFRLALSGEASLPGRWLDIGALLAPPGGAPKVPFVLRGPIEAPTFELDANGGRSGTGLPALPIKLLR
jgi:uncharacterized protein involved in outer membrane biogenesis